MTELKDWTGRPAPKLQSTRGRYVAIAPARLPEDGEALFAAICGAGNDDLWRYIPIGPFETATALCEAMQVTAKNLGWETYLLRSPDKGVVLGMASYMRIRPDAGSAEVGCIIYSKDMQRRPAATEAMYLMAKHIFDDLGYRRYEWKCDNANEASKRAALRLGFRFEGVFRQDMVMKGRNRDTAWFSIIDAEWPAVKAGFEAWLAAENFDKDGQQRRSLTEFQVDA